ncbi:NO-inducible flavohemoprotein [Dyella mobilis]|uniref:nitric oxide dioxygenase n=1 Tax=Dyella mobilis TaxID=1849582 RepID=A0ABS2KHP7_9GAMM|nr:NO-inducible flavohemoprotein [Dyella mobilis]MBM7130619.1 NO-inducible flavohemoprotein [Dyella mobilis]GLQ97246.1 flavohemoprotein [Dyella mobilis]
MLTQAQRDIVKSCVPALKAHGLALTRNFYTRMFEGNPELKHLFNMSHQASGEQQQALAMAVLGYAQNIDDPSVLAPVIGVITAKHVSMGIRAEHYPIVGHHLLAAIGEVMGEAATAEVLDAWAAAYGQLADLLIAAEQALYTQAASVPGGWSGWRPFHVQQVVRESSEIVSFYLKPTDAGALPPFQPGQFVSVRIVDAEGMARIRQYSLSDAPHQEHLRLTVKREDGHGDAPSGRVSTMLHVDVAEGDVIELSFPQGHFVVDQQKATPLVLLSGGVGITPMLGMLGHVTRQQPERTIHFAHAARNREVHAMNDWLRAMAARHERLDVEIYYENVGVHDVAGVHYDKHGRMDAAQIAANDRLADADYYVCGPRGFMTTQIDALKQAGIPDTRIHAEFFGAALA